MKVKKISLVVLIISILISSLMFGQDFIPSPGPTTTWFTAPSKLINRRGYAASICDLNNDWKMDMVLVSKTKLEFLINNPDSSSVSGFDRVSYNDLTVYGSTMHSMALHDINRDGILDVYVGFSSYMGEHDYKSTFINDGDGYSFTSYDCNNQHVGSEKKSITPRTILFADFNGDTYYDSFHSTNPYTIYYEHNYNRLHPGTADWKQFGNNAIQVDSLKPNFWYNTDVGSAYENFSHIMGKSTVIRDFNNDGKPDLVFGTYADIDNWGNGFEEFPLTWEAGLYVLQNCSTLDKIDFKDVYEEGHYVPALDKDPIISVYSIVPADFDRDGDLDLFVGGVTNKSVNQAKDTNPPIVKIYRNISTPDTVIFEDVTATSRLSFINNQLSFDEKCSITLADAAPVDIDNDGYVDLVVTNRLWAEAPPAYDQCFVLKNLGHETDIKFEFVGVENHGLDQLSRGLAYGDLNNDGLIDIICIDGKNEKNGGQDEFRFYYNQHQTGNNYIKLDLREPGSNNNLLHSIGSKVTVYKAGTTEIIGYDEVRTDYCYRSKRDPMLHFGLGDVENVDVSITTRYGKEFSYKNLTANKIHGLLLWSLKNKQEVFFSF